MQLARRLVALVWVVLALQRAKEATASQLPGLSQQEQPLPLHPPVLHRGTPPPSLLPLSTRAPFAVEHYPHSLQTASAELTLATPLSSSWAVGMLFTSPASPTGCRTKPAVARPPLLLLVLVLALAARLRRLLPVRAPCAASQPPLPLQCLTQLLRLQAKAHRCTCRLVRSCVLDKGYVFERLPLA